MRVLMTTMGLEIGGAETHILEAAKALKDRGVEVTVMSNGGVYAKELENYGIRHIWAPMHSKKPWYVKKAYGILKDLLDRERFDVIHAHARIPAFLCRGLAKKYQTRFVTTAHLTFKVNALWKKIAAWGERTVAVSDDIKQYLIDNYGLCPDNITVTVNGINTDTYHPALDWSAAAEEFSLSPEKRRIVAVSRMDKDRSAAAVCLAELAPRIYKQFPDTELLLVGGGDDFARLEKTAKRANKEIGFDYVKLTGARTDVNRLIASATVFVNVSRSALEAMAMAKPVILGGNEGYLGIFRRDKLQMALDTNLCCRGCPPLNAETLLADLTTLLQMQDRELEALGQDNREIMREYFSVDRMARDYLAMYEAVRPFQPYRYGDILICGYYGFRNMGDDSLLRAITENLRKENPDCRITVMSKNPKETEKIYGTRAVQRFDPFAVLRAMSHAKLLIFGGGNLLQDGSSARSLTYYTWILRLAKLKKLKIMVYANGVGPLGRSGKRRSARALARADRITLRERDSLEACEAMKLPAEKLSLTADPAFTLREADPSWVRHLCRRFSIRPDGKYFVVALREWKENAEEKKKACAALCDRIYEQYGYTPVFLPMHDPLDNAVNRETAALCTCRTLFLSGVTGSELLGILRRMEFVIAMRLHTLIYSTAVGVPSVGLAYDGKLRAFMETMELPFMAEEPEPTEILGLIARLTDERDALRESLLARHEALAELAARDAHEAIRLLEEKERNG